MFHKIYKIKNESVWLQCHIHEPQGPHKVHGFGKDLSLYTYRVEYLKYYNKLCLINIKNNKNSKQTFVKYIFQFFFKLLANLLIFFVLYISERPYFYANEMIKLKK